VPADNNACERALRPSVIHRKVMGSFRSDWGAQTYAALATVLNTAKPNGENAFQKLVQLMGPPVLPFLLLPASGVQTVTIIILITWRSK
jgi:transposase